MTRLCSKVGTLHADLTPPNAYCENVKTLLSIFWFNKSMSVIHKSFLSMYVLTLKLFEFNSSSLLCESWMSGLTICPWTSFTKITNDITSTVGIFFIVLFCYLMTTQRRVLIRSRPTVIHSPSFKCCNYLSQWWVEFEFDLTWDCLKQLRFQIKCD